MLNLFRAKAWPILAGIVLVVLLALLRLADPLPVAAIRDMGFDLEQRLLPRPASDSVVRVVDIDEASLRSVGQWPWPRTTLATLAERLNQLGAAAIGFDVLFAEPDRLAAANDIAFAQTIGHAPVVLGFSLSPTGAPLSMEPRAGVAISGSDPTPSLPPIRGAVAPLQLLADAAPGLGSLSLDAAETPGAVRRVPLLWASGSKLYPSLSVETLRLALGAGTLVALGDTAGGHTLEALRIGQFTVPTAANGDLVLYDRPLDPRQTISAAVVLGDDWHQLADEIAGRIVLVGTSASGLLDLHQTPLARSVPGVSIHAAVIDQIIAQKFLSRADWLQGLEIVVMVAAGLMLILVVLRLGPLPGLLTGAALVAALIAVAWVAFAARGWQVDATYPVFSSTLIFGAMVYLQYAATDRNRRELRRAFAHYVAPPLLAEIERNAGELRLGGETRELTVMFADLRGFTGFTETHGPEETLSMLNAVFGALGAEIVDRSGTIDKFIGDSIMAFWNAPLPVADHPRLACAAALAMRARLAELNRDGRFGQLAVGVGIATGAAVVGNMGLTTRFDYSAIGDTVNVASRVETESKRIGFDIVASAATRHAAPELAWLPAGTVPLKGRSGTTALHVLVGDAELAATPAFAALESVHKTLLADLGRDGAFADCRERAAAVDQNLVRFYDRLAERSADFSTPA